MVSVMGKRGLFLVWLCLVSILPGMAQTEKLIDYVNPFVGTNGYGNVYPGAQIPFGGIQMSPDTDSNTMMRLPVINIIIPPCWGSV